MSNVIFLCVLFIANVIQAITGFAGTVLAMPPAMSLIGIDDAKVVLSAMALLSGGLIAIQNYKHIDFKELAKMTIMMFVGMLVGMKIYDFLPADTLLFIYGVIVIAIGIKNLVIKKELTFNKIVGIVILLLSGIIHGMFVSGGTLLVIYAVQVLKDKNVFRATIAPIWLILNIYLLANYNMNGLITSSNVKLILVSIIPLFVAIWLGNKLQKRINQQLFLKIAYVLLIVSGLSIL